MSRRFGRSALLVTLAVATAPLGCQQEGPPVAMPTARPANPEQAIGKVLDAWHAAAARTHRSEPEARDPDRPAQAAVPQLHVMLTRTLGDAQHARFVGFCVGFLAPGKRHITARQALGCAFEVQVHNIE